MTKVTFVDETGERFFGEGPARLLRGIGAYGSLRCAAGSMNMAYTKALRLLNHAEKALGFPLTTRVTGGRDGGGSKLTPEGEAWLMRYEAYRDACREANRELFRQFFPQAGCVILASGMARRFGGNKLLAEFGGEPMLLRALEATRSLQHHRVVVTRHAQVAELCRERAVPVVLHDQPSRSDTIRLGLEALGDVDVCLFLPGDQPLLRRETVDSLIAQWEKDRERIIRPVSGGRPGSPALFPRWTFPELKELPEGTGGSWLMGKYPDRVTDVEIPDPWELMDADTPEELAELQTHHREEGEKWKQR